jgi:hypothetical protein
MTGGRAGAKAEPHAILDEVERARRRGTLLLFDVYRDGGTAWSGTSEAFLLAMIVGAA